MTVIEKILANKRVDSISDERELGDGFWVYLKRGWQCDPETHCVHEDTPTACLKRLQKEVEPCNCDECREHFREKFKTVKL